MYPRGRKTGFDDCDTEEFPQPKSSQFRIFNPKDFQQQFNSKSESGSNAYHNDPHSPIGLTVGKSKFTISKYLSKGSFGCLYLGTHLGTNQEVAIKIERIDCEKPQLHLEYGFYKKLLQIPKGVPKIYTFGPCGRWNALVMELLGPNLEKMLELCGGRFSLRSIIQLVIQFLFLFRSIHECGLLYRDTKPANFLLGQPSTSKWWIIHVVDLGFCKEWRQEDGQHIPYQENKPFTGTVRYMSINNNLGHEQSRRDDLEALAYMMIYFFKGRLPWQGIIASTITKRYMKICQSKLETPIETLCSNMPNEFAMYLRKVRSLNFNERPDYGSLLTPFVDLLAREFVLDLNDKVYDWTQTHRIKPLYLRFPECNPTKPISMQEIKKFLNLIPFVR
ncbi:hypothetical protein NH340_JMT05602 [Sarcoptes scabiei]|nr:hypothetical protein NH340_JMT05602 [Sarcoptes scabiei]